MPFGNKTFRSKLNHSLPQLCAAGCFLLLMTLLAAATGQWCWQPNGYNSYTLQALAWLEGRLDLGQDYPWLELAIYQGKYYVSFPPFPSILLLPFAALFGANTPDGIISLLFSLAGIWTAVSLARKAGCSPCFSVILALFLYTGTGYLFLALTPAVWFFAQTLCFNLCIFSLYAAMTGRGGPCLACWACAVGCRPMVLLYLPVLLMLLGREYHRLYPRDSLLSAVRKHWYWAVAPVLIGIVYMALNALRFGSIFEFGHNYLPEFQRAENGQFSLSYFWHNFTLLFRLPGLDTETGRITFQPFEAWCFVLINPLFCLSVWAGIAALRRENRAGRRLVIAVLAISLIYIVILCCHRTLGGWQFGNRYFKDIMPFLFALLCLCIPKSSCFRRVTFILFICSLSFHLLGTAITWNYWW